MHYGEAAYWEARYEDEIRKNTSGQFEVIPNVLLSVYDNIKYIEL